jgi:hypothetical protein
MGKRRGDFSACAQPPKIGSARGPPPITQPQVGMKITNTKLGSVDQPLENRVRSMAELRSAQI